MKYQKGQSGNPAGKPTGTKNRTTEEIREKLKTFIEANIETITADFQTLTPIERLMMFEKLLKYAIPPYQSIDLRKEPTDLKDLFMF